MRKTVAAALYLTLEPEACVDDKEPNETDAVVVVIIAMAMAIVTARRQRVISASKAFQMAMAVSLC